MCYYGNDAEQNYLYEVYDVCVCVSVSECGSFFDLRKMRVSDSVKICYISYFPFNARQRNVTPVDAGIPNYEGASQDHCSEDSNH